MYYVLVDIGYLECGEYSNCIGIFTDKLQAEELAKIEEKAQKTNWHGEHSYEIFEVSELDTPRFSYYKP